MPIGVNIAKKSCLISKSKNTKIFKLFIIIRVAEKTKNNKNIIVGKKTIKPRMTKVPTIIPLPKKKHYISIYELQK